MNDNAKMEILKAIANGDIGRAREIGESINAMMNELMDESVPAWRKRPKYYYDENGYEYWYDLDGKRHYTRLEG